VKFVFFNDTGREVSLHAGTFLSGCTGEPSPIQPLETRTLVMPPGTYPWVKLWDQDAKGTMLLLSAVREDTEA
jgi:hypothetical protein